MRNVLVAAALCFFSLACGGAKTPPPLAAGPVDAGDVAVSGSAAGGTAAGSPTDDAGVTGVTPVASNTAADPAATAPADPHPFAKDAAAAESMIDDAIESRHSGVEKCAAETRKRAGDPHAKVSLLVGIDQEGNVIGIKTPKGEKKDEKLLTCVRAALKDAPFPKSHSGVITIKKTYEDTIKGQL